MTNLLPRQHFSLVELFDGIELVVGLAFHQIDLSEKIVDFSKKKKKGSKRHQAVTSPKAPRPRVLITLKSSVDSLSFFSLMITGPSVGSGQ